MIKTNYKKIAPTYNTRYTANYLVSVEKELLKIISSNNYLNILEAGCGTGNWIKALNNTQQKILGLDYSLDMLRVSKIDKPELCLVIADATQIPVKDNLFDLIFCVNAIHHFPDKEKFINECKRILLKNGMIAVFGVDPHIDKDWYVYDYFDSVYKNDLKRFPSLKFLERLLEKDFGDIKIKTVEKIYNERIGTEIFEDPFLQKHHSSQLANLSDEDYEKGIAKIKNQIDKNSQTVFKTSVIFYLVSAKKK